MSKTIRKIIASDSFYWFFFFVIIIFILVFYSEFTDSNSIFVAYSHKFIPLKIPYSDNIIAFCFGLMCLMVAYILALIISSKIYEIILESISFFSVFTAHESKKIDLLKNENIEIPETSEK